MKGVYQSQSQLTRGSGEGHNELAMQGTGLSPGEKRIWCIVIAPPRNCCCQGCYRYFTKVSPIFNIDAGFKSIVDTDIDTLP